MDYKIERETRWSRAEKMKKLHCLRRDETFGLLLDSFILVLLCYL